MIRGHGAFAAAATLYEALHLLSSLEMSSRIVVLTSRHRSLQDGE